MINMINLLGVLIFAHLLADFPLQGQYLSDHKSGSSLLMFIHCAIWTGCISVATIVFGMDISIIDVAILLIPHFIIDTLKAKSLVGYTKLNYKQALLLDQTLHLIQLIVFIILKTRGAF